MISVIRAGAALVLGVVIFVGFLFFLILNNVSDKLLSADFYKDTIAAEDTYNRIYEEVLLDKELLDTTAELLGGIDVVSHDDIVDLLRQIIPPDYIQSQVEESIDRIVGYIDKETDHLDLSVELGPPLENVKPILLAYINDRIAQLPLDKPIVPRCDFEVMEDVADGYEEVYRGLIAGKMPASIPSFEAIFQPCRIPTFDIAFMRLMSDQDLDQRVKVGLQVKKSDLRKEADLGNTLGFWQLAAPAVATPLMDDQLDKVRANLDDQDRLDLIHQIAVWNPDRSEAQIRADLDEGREWISRARSFGEVTTLIMVIGGAILLGLVNFPQLTGMLRGPGMALLLTGVVFFVLGKVAESEVPERLTALIETSADKVSGVPPSVTDLGGDILISFGAQLTDGFVGPSLTLIIVGAILVGASFFVFPIKRFIPFVK